jgi:hypothetical protein
MKSALPGVMRLVAVLLLIAGVVLGIFEAYGNAKAPITGDETFAARLPALTETVAMVLGLVGIGVLIYGVAETLDSVLLSAQARREDSLSAMADLQQSIRRTELAIERVGDQIKETSIRGPAHLGDIGAADTVASSTISLTESMHLMMTTLQEIREIALLSDKQRQEKLAENREQRRSYLIVELRRLLDANEWSAADTLMIQLESEFPDYPNLPALRSELHGHKSTAEQGALSQLRERVEDLMAVWAWDQAYAETARFVENFPEQAEGRDLLQRVMTERDNYIESTANRLYEEIRTDVDRRFYRRAMANAVKLLECAPGHAKSVAIRGQLKIIRENAEIEERQEQERRIQDLIRNKQFFDAIDLAEDLLQRFPNSPQAETLQKLLPKMRELAIGAETQEV